MKINPTNMSFLQAQDLRSTANKYDGKSFTDFLKDSLSEVNNLQKTGDEMSVRFAGGDPQVDIHDLMLALEEASIAKQLTIEIRNKLVEAYQEIMRMQV